ncbi:50S ribosomal protein L25/general stress protein Ctc [Dietzia sp. E1]|uniref:50S ribosomal protein L25/general stress protein Ctc n=1 Tax=Dietzia sp. E1 TaxID=328361 RepID=UPI0001F64D67|nr:50S ribosomal protein L25/general stress protein Ctc [Dietzia sp. E1]EFV91745.1 50S ribosomal protein L25/general stress protein Ctc [Dietzia cinnamea P4]MBB1022163.1 50S ribosomal protein L25/general stress protein Ctc [Dietzia sp. E1]
MSDVNKLAATVRTEFGKGASRRARRDFKVPAVLYGHNTEPRHLLLGALEFAAILRHAGTNALLTLDIEGEEQLALPKQIDVHPLTRVIEHTDLIVVRKGEKVVVEIAVLVTGEAAPGTLVTTDADVIEVEVDALNIPEDFEVSVEDAQAGTQITAADVTLPAGATLISDPETLLVNVMEAPSGADLEADEEAAPEGAAAEDAAKAAEEG